MEPLNHNNLSQLTCKLHELVKVLDTEDGFPQLPEVELQHTGHRVDVVAVGHVGQGVLAPLEALAEIVNLRLKMMIQIKNIYKRKDVMGNSEGN